MSTDFDGNIIGTAEEKEQAVIVSVLLPGMSEHEMNASFDELERLLETAGGEVFAKLVQSKDNPDSRTYIGSGKLAELASLCNANDIGLVVFDCELSPSQIRNIEDGIGNEVRVIDRSMLILDIFALHATSGEGKLQVELAQLKYTVPRLAGKGLSMSRQQGGNIAMRGPGETKLESDRRYVRRRMEALEEKLSAIEKNRKVQRSSRERSGIIKVAIAGYTNAGKSTILNYLTGAGILAENKLFATLDPTTRKYELPDGTEILLTDTVGFIRNLPHHLIKAFRSTLEEVAYSDMIIVVVDVSDPEHANQLEVTEKLMEELGAGDKPILYVYNKCDISGVSLTETFAGSENSRAVFVSAKTGFGMDRLAQKLAELAHLGKTDVTFVIPNAEQSALNILYKNAVVKDIEYGDEAVTILATADEKTKGMLAKYIAK